MEDSQYWDGNKTTFSAVQSSLLVLSMGNCVLLAWKALQKFQVAWDAHLDEILLNTPCTADNDIHHGVLCQILQLLPGAG